jgi:metal-responsive CopG/Arc/MetJ family transcriptional regulator
METICLKMEENMLKDMDNALKNNWYSTRTEFIREAIRDKLSEIEKEEAIKKLAAMRGALKGQRKTNLTEEQVREKVGREIAKKHGIKLD